MLPNHRPSTIRCWKEFSGMFFVYSDKQMKGHILPSWGKFWTMTGQCKWREDYCPFSARCFSFFSFANILQFAILAKDLCGFSVWRTNCKSNKLWIFGFPFFPNFSCGSAVLRFLGPKYPSTPSHTSPANWCRSFSENEMSVFAAKSVKICIFSNLYSWV